MPQAPGYPVDCHPPFHGIMTEIPYDHFQDNVTPYCFKTLIIAIDDGMFINMIIHLIFPTLLGLPSTHYIPFLRPISCAPFILLSCS